MCVEVLCCIDRVLSTKECAYCICDPSVLLSVPSICFVYGFVCQKLSPDFRVGSQVFALIMLFLCVICILYGRVRACAMHLAIWYVVLVCHQFDVCKNYVGSV